MNQLIKHPHENKQQYLWRVDGLIRAGVYKNWQDVVQTVNQQLFDDPDDYLGESAYRKQVAAARSFYEAGVFNKLSETTYINNLKEERRKLEEARVKYRDERAAYSRELRSETRLNDTLERISEMISSSTPYTDYDDTQLVLSNSENDIIACLSDYHCGWSAKRTALNDDYNEDVAISRLSYYLAKIKSIGYRHQSGSIYVVLLGDQIDGRIHYTQALEGRTNLVEQLCKAAEDIGWFLHELSMSFNTVNVISIAGNHSRIGKKDEVLRDERLDDLIPWYLKAKLSNIGNIKFIGEYLDPTIVSWEIRGKCYFAVHGDIDTFDSSGVQKLVMFTHKIPDGIFMGHKHTTDYSESSGVSLIRSGTFVSGGDYIAKNRLVSRPTQAVCVVDDCGIQAFYPVDVCV